MEVRSHSEARMKKPNWFQRVILRQRDWRIPPGKMFRGNRFWVFGSPDYSRQELIEYLTDALVRSRYIDQPMTWELRIDPEIGTDIIEVVFQDGPNVGENSVKTTPI